MNELIDFSSIGIWWQDTPGRFGEVLCGARGSWLPVVFPVGRLPSRLHILVTQRTAPEPVSILMLDFWVEPLRADMSRRWFPRLNPAPEPSGVLHIPSLNRGAYWRLGEAARWFLPNRRIRHYWPNPGQAATRKSLSYFCFGQMYFWTFDYWLFLFWIAYTDDTFIFEAHLYISYETTMIEA